MAALTVTEKNHWKERISRKLDQAIEQLLTTNDPGLMKRIRHQAKEQALEALQLNEWRDRLQEIKAQEEAASIERKNIYRAMVTAVTGIPEEQLGHYYAEPPEVAEARRRRESYIEEQLLAETPLGRQILTFRREKEELLDTVWLATSGKQIKQLWSRVIDVLDQQPTPFQREALAIEPVEGE